MYSTHATTVLSIILFTFGTSPDLEVPSIASPPCTPRAAADVPVARGGKKQKRSPNSTDAELEKIHATLEKPPDKAARFCAMLADHVQKCPELPGGELHILLLPTAVQYSRMRQCKVSHWGGKFGPSKSTSSFLETPSSCTRGGGATPA